MNWKTLVKLVPPSKDLDRIEKCLFEEDLSRAFIHTAACIKFYVLDVTIEELGDKNLSWVFVSYNGPVDTMNRLSTILGYLRTDQKNQDLWKIFVNLLFALLAATSSEDTIWADVAFVMTRECEYTTQYYQAIAASIDLTDEDIDYGRLDCLWQQIWQDKTGVLN
jgi:hypothetical protein